MKGEECGIEGEACKSFPQLSPRTQETRRTITRGVGFKPLAETEREKGALEEAGSESEGRSQNSSQ